jgi:hypothetical protein
VWVSDVPYYENTPSERIWEITGCKGDMNNDRVVDPNDEYPFDLALNDPSQYALYLPGLEGSMIWHGDMDCDNDLDADDQEPFDYFIDEGCTNCTPECQYRACVADIDEDGEVTVLDLALLLASYGLCEGDPGFDPDADLDADGCVGQLDLAWLLAEYGNLCDCYAGGGDGGGMGGPGLPTPEGITVSVDPHDTGGFTGDGFAGESDHFVFDLVIEIADNADDWTTSGVVALAENGGVFRLASEPTDPDPYASFVSAPWPVDGNLPGNNAGAIVAGAYLPAHSDYVFDSSSINLTWFDTVDSNDGPAAVMRLVIDVSGVVGADTSAGLGSVYFSTTGPAQQEDILVADLASESGTVDSVPSLEPLSGEFYVKGE